MQILREGILSDLFDAATKPAEIPMDANRGIIDKLLDPLDANDLYDMVVERLRSIKGNSKVVQPYVMPLFFPKTNKEMEDAYKKLRDKHPKMSEDINPNLYDDYEYKLQNAIIEFCTVDAFDIIKRVQYVYKQKDKNINVYDIPSKVYVGTIIKEIYSGNYDLINKMTSIYREYVKMAQKSEWQYKKPQDSAEDNLRKDRKKRSRIEDKAFQLVSDFKTIKPEEEAGIRRLISTTSGNTAQEIADNVIKYLLHIPRGDR